MTTKNIPISQIENNTGQVEGLPGNPRITNPVKLDKLVESIKQDPEMLQLRGLLVYPFADDKYITIGGNMRLQALKRLNYTECPCIVIPKDTPVAKLRNYIVKDNGEFGDWDYKALLAEWDAAELESWAIDVQPFEDEETKGKNAPDGTPGKTPKKAFATWLTTSHGIQSATSPSYHVSRRVKKAIRFRSSSRISTMWQSSRKLQ